MNTRRIYFRDQRPPDLVQHELERRMMLLLEPADAGGQLTFSARGVTNGSAFAVRLTLIEAGMVSNDYVLEFEGEDLSPDPSGKGRPLDGWLDFWCRDFTPTATTSITPASPISSTPRQQRLVEQALSAEAHLADVPAIQQLIVESLRAGARFATSHKEGGTSIFWRGGRFIRVEEGECPSTDTFADEVIFLAFLRRHFHHTVSRTMPQITEYQEWKLILRLMLPAR